MLIAIYVTGVITLIFNGIVAFKFDYELDKIKKEIQSLKGDKQ